jgi:hypothetical protein
MAAREERVARNQALFRAANEAIVGPVRPEGLLTFLCECGDETCMTTIELTSDEYEHVRDDGRRFAIVVGHQMGGETVVEESERFSVVEKQGQGGDIVERMDPRARRKE